MLRFETTEQKEQKTVAASRQSAPPQEHVTLRKTTEAEQTTAAAVEPHLHIGRVMRLVLGMGVPLVLILHLQGLFFTSALASASLVLAFFLMSVAALPPLQSVRLRDAFRDDVYAFSPFVREVLEVAFWLLMGAGSFADSLDRQIRLGGTCLMAVPLLLMALAASVKAYGLRPRRTDNR